jgi:hypothetical protein
MDGTLIEWYEAMAQYFMELAAYERDLEHERRASPLSRADA